MRRLNEKLRYFLIYRNYKIHTEFEYYLGKIANTKGHGKIRKLWTLFRLNWHYRVLKSGKPIFKKVQNVKLPYLEGAESTLHNRKDALQLVAKLERFDIVSFDIFDTLVLRNVANPKDLFNIIGNKLGVPYFMEIRSAAERDARNKMKELEGHTEVTINDIYELISYRTGLDVEKGIQAELEAEREFCFANSYMKRVFNLLKEQDKEIIITSDMYIPHDEMKKLLASCGYSDYSKLRVSCDYKCNKRNGGLYKILKEDYKDKTIIHVGDNHATDIVSAEKEGIKTEYYKNCHEIGNVYRVPGMSGVVGSVYAGVVNTTLHNGLNVFPTQYEYGFTYGGLYIYGFCSWIHKKAIQDGVDKVLFLARDGAIYKKVFDMMFDDIPNEYVYWSRIANLMYTAENNRHDLITRVVNQKANNIIPCTIKEVLGSVGLESLCSNLKDFGLAEEEKLSHDNKAIFEDFLISNYSKVLKAYQKEANYAAEIIDKITKGCKRVAIVDVGWLGSGPIGMKSLIQMKCKNKCDVKCYTAASQHYMINKNVNELMNEHIVPYIFSPNFNRDLFDTHTYTNFGMNCINFELFTQAEQPSFAGYTKDGGYKFDVPEVQNYKTTKMIQKGIFDFCVLYHKATEKNQYLRNIFGRDAYLPFLHVIKNTKLLKLAFSDIAFSRNVGVDIKTQRQETYGEIIRKVEAKK